MQNLKKILAQPDTIIFIGSGISLWSGLPTWSALIEQLASFVCNNGGDPDLIRAESSRGDLLQAASYGFDKLTKHQIGDFIRSACLSGKAKPHAIHQKIISLGPTCFITTNYDDLLERCISQSDSSNSFRPPITNRHLTEMAGIIHARSSHFIFKPHGDAYDTDSVILTREQYRQLLPNGERQAALESLKVLMASRPVLYLGFGLRDPDFIYIRDLLTNTYRGGTRDHFAIMPDIKADEQSYWRNNYGIHLVGYSTTASEDGSRNHTKLLELLDNLIKEKVKPRIKTFTPDSPEVLLALARHAASLSNITRASPEFPINVSELDYQKTHKEFRHGKVEDFFERMPLRSLLIGLPGAGKSYSIRQAAGKLALALNKICLGENCNINDLTVPILADLKNYKGDLISLLSDSLPPTITVDEVIENFNLTIFLDSFNEMPREVLEKGTYTTDLSNLFEKAPQAKILIGSRTSDGLSDLNLCAYKLDEIDIAFVKTALNSQGITLNQKFKREMLWLLQRPYFFSHLQDKDINFSEITSPKDFYSTYIKNIETHLNEQFSLNLNLIATLSRTANDSLSSGLEAFPIEIITRHISEALPNSSLPPLDIINWLISKSFLISYPQGRVGFIHQSVTEYLAATYLANQYLQSPSILLEKIAFKRWDQALFLTLSLLPHAHFDSFIKDVIKIDLSLAINAAKYLEFDQEIVTQEILSYTLQHLDNQDYRVAFSLENHISASKSHEPVLLQLAETGGTIGSAAATILLRTFGNRTKPLIYALIKKHCEDFNFCSHICSSLANHITASDIEDLTTLINDVSQTLDHQNGTAFAYGIKSLLHENDLTEVYDLLKPENADDLKGEILCEILSSHKSSQALEIAGTLLLKGVRKAPISIYFIAEYTKETLSWETYNIKHALCLIEGVIAGTSDSRWNFAALRHLCLARENISSLVKSHASEQSGLTKITLLYAATNLTTRQAFEELEHNLSSLPAYPNSKELRLIENFNWENNKDLAFKLIKLKNRSLANFVTGGSISHAKRNNTSSFEVNDINEWCEWLKIEFNNEDDGDGDGDWFVNKISNFLGKNMGESSRKQILDSFNLPHKEHRSEIYHFFISNLDVTSDELSDSAANFIIKELISPSYDLKHGPLLGIHPSEDFVINRILPLLTSSTEKARRRITQVLEEAGSTHGRRYLA